MAYAPRPFDFCAFRTAAIEGEAPPPARAPFPELARHVAAELDLYTPAELWGPSRQAPAVFARNAVWWLARRWTKLSFPQIGRLSTSPHRRGVPMDHSTVIHGVRRFDAWREGAAHYADMPTYADWLARR